MNVRHRLSRASGNAAATYATATQVLLAKADVAYAHASLLRIHAKGNFGEAIAQRYFLKNRLGEQINGRWCSLTPRAGRQGFDHLFFRQRGGKFYWMVCESKYGTSQLGTTKGGVQQMSWVWIHDRAAKLGDIYLKLADRSVTVRAQPWFKSGLKTYDVPLADGTKATFWKDKDGKWHFDGPKEKLAEAREKARQMGADLKSPSCRIRGRKFHITAQGNDVHVTLEDLKSSTGSKTVEGSTFKHEIILKDVLNKKISDEDLKKAIAEELRKKFPNLKADEIKDLAEQIAEAKTNGSLLKEAMSMTGQIALQASIAGAVAGILDAAMQIAFTRQLCLKRTALAAGAAMSGVVTGELASIVFVKTRGGAVTVRVLQRAFGLRSATLMRNTIAGGVGAIVTSAAMAYGSVWLGRSTLEDAHVEFATGVIGTAGGALVVIGATSAVAAWGTAGTGAAISGLAGAAQSNAILAWFGMGLGKAAGGFMLTGIGAVAGVVIGIGAAFTFGKIKESFDRDYLINKGNLINQSNVWQLIAARTFPIAYSLPHSRPLSAKL